MSFASPSPTTTRSPSTLMLTWTLPPATVASARQRRDASKKKWRMGSPRCGKTRAGYRRPRRSGREPAFIWAAISTSLDGAGVLPVLLEQQPRHLVDRALRLRIRLVARHHDAEA